MALYLMITNRNILQDGLGTEMAPLSFWSTNSPDVATFANWKQLSADDFRRLVIDTAQKFPIFDAANQEKQLHVNLFIHGYADTWQASASHYAALCEKLFGEQGSMGLCILFSWPSKGDLFGYYPDRKSAEASALELTEVFNDLYEWMLRKQREAAIDPALACRAKTSVIAHSMGNYVLQRALAYAWSHNNQPLLISLINQLVMVAADVDNDLFGSGETVDKSDGDAIANLTYRVTALYTGRDPVLGMSAGLKHFGKRRLGRSGLDPSKPVPDNVWDVDCSRLFPEDEVDIHSAYFKDDSTIDLMRLILRGTDRKIIDGDVG